MYGKEIVRGGFRLATLALVPASLPQSITIRPKSLTWKLIKQSIANAEGRRTKHSESRFLWQPGNHETHHLVHFASLLRKKT